MIARRQPGLTFDEYSREVFAGLGLEWTGECSRDQRLDESLGLDSLKVFELLVLTEELGGLTHPPDSVSVIQTLGDAFDYYQSIDGAG